MRRNKQPVQDRFPLVFYLTFFSFIVMILSSGLLYGVWLLLVNNGVVQDDSLNLRRMLLWMLIVSSTISAVLVFVLGNWFIFKSIRELSDASARVAHGDYTPHLEIPKEREIGELVRNFNHMTNQLSKKETLSSDFITGISHEFKTPLSAIEGYATLLQDERLTKEEQALYVSRILENTSRLSKLTHSILSLSQLENQEIVLQQEVYSLDEQIRRVLLSYEPLWEEKELSIDLALESTQIYGSKSLLAQVWSNLIDNAIKFSRPGGTLFVSCWEFDGKIVGRVRDSGIGMSEEVRQHAFDKFYQGERSHSGQGSGLGLALVRRIVALSGGTIELQSKEGKGTEITVTLKYEQPKSAT